MTFQLIFWCDVSDGTMETFIVVVLDEFTHYPFGIFKRKRGLRANTTTLQRLMPPLDFS